MTTEQVEILRKTGLTEKEAELISMAADLWNKYMQLPITHPMERSEFASKIHEIQDHIAARHVFVELNAHYSGLNECDTPSAFPIKPIPPPDRKIKEGEDFPNIAFAGVVLALCGCLMAVCKIWGWGWILTFAVVCFYIDKESKQ